MNQEYKNFTIYKNIWLLALIISRALTMIKGIVMLPITSPLKIKNPSTVYIRVRNANNKLALLGLFQARIIASITIKPGRRAPRNSQNPKPGSKSNSIVKKKNPTSRASILGAKYKAL